MAPLKTVLFRLNLLSYFAYAVLLKFTLWKTVQYQ